MQRETKGGLFAEILYGCPATEGQFNLPRIYGENIEKSHCRSTLGIATSKRDKRIFYSPTNYRLLEDTKKILQISFFFS